MTETLEVVLDATLSYKLNMAGVFFLGMSAFFWFRGPIVNNKQLVYRIAVFALGVGLMTAGFIVKLVENNKGK